MLTREGIVRLLEEANVEVLAQAEDAATLLRDVRPRASRCRDRRHPHAADAHRRGARRRAADPPGASRDRSAAALPLRRAELCLRLLDRHPKRVGYLLKERVSTLPSLSKSRAAIAPFERPSATRPRPPARAGTTRQAGRRDAVRRRGATDRRVDDRLSVHDSPQRVTPRTVEAHVKQIILKLRLAANSERPRRSRIPEHAHRRRRNCGQPQSNRRQSPCLPR